MNHLNSTVLFLFSLATGLTTPAVFSSELFPKDSYVQLQTKDTRMLLNWAIHLSRYESIDSLPTIVFVDHEQLVNQACFGHECQVLGWYNDSDIVYIDDRFSDSDTLFSRSLIVHELVHYLQHKSGRYSQSCPDVSAREAEAYWIQQEYHIANGTFGQIRRHFYHCDIEIAAEIETDPGPEMRRPGPAHSTAAVGE